jgi:ribosomal protein L22
MSPREPQAGAEGAKPDEEKAKVEAEAAESKANEAQEEAAEEAEATEAAPEPEPKEKPKRRRRASETPAGTEKKSARRDSDEVINVRARARYVRTAPRKARLVMDHIRNKDVEQARAILAYAPRAAAVDVLKLLDSAVANAEHNHELGPDELRVRRAYVDEGPTIKRYRPRALGRATPINKRTSHMTIELTTEGK